MLTLPTLLTEDTIPATIFTAPTGSILGTQNLHTSRQRFGRVHIKGQLSCWDSKADSRYRFLSYGKMASIRSVQQQKRSYAKRVDTSRMGSEIEWAQ
jgi:hypothetical protein